MKRRKNGQTSVQKSPKGEQARQWIKILFTPKVMIAIGILAALLVVGGMFLFTSCGKNKPAQILSSSSLSKIVETSNLSTAEFVYTGVCTVYNQEKPENVDYYLCYDATVQVGFDTNDVKIEQDSAKKVIQVQLPEIKITSVEVDINSLDYLFMNDAANNSTVTAKAYDHACKDAESKCKQEEAIYELGKENAKQVIEALLKPFVESVDPEYHIEFVEA